MVEVVVYNGVTYRRWPDSKYKEKRTYFHKWIGGAKGGYVRLHRIIWEEHHGLIPDGYHIHHRDGNPSNNDISNLECLTPREHYLRHIQDLQAWGKSEEGRKWRSKMLKETWPQRKLTASICAFCANPFKGYYSKYCCSNCQINAWRHRKRELLKP